MSSISRRKLLDRAMTALTALCAAFAVISLFVILGYILFDGLRALNLGFLLNSFKPIGEPDSGIAGDIVGSVLLIGVGSLIGMPIGILAGIYLSEFGSNKFGTVLRFLVDTLTGTPSIIIGVFVWTVMVHPMGHFSALSGAVSLAIMMMPIVARTTEEMIRLVPHSLREAGLALGAPKWRVTLGVVLRTAASGVATGAMLAIARIAGETAPLLFTALGLNYLSTDLMRPMGSLTVRIFYYAGSPYEEWHNMAWAATLVLVTIILVLNVTVKILARNRHQQA
ncbi:MAG TPA: phosphate ABC transporter permease PstA [Blastocatellia bacterium]|nr:phosphate ABC transporter permease PstA [Blastocatellia bacterium]